MKERLTILMIVALAVGVLAPTAHAGMALELQSGATTLTIGDNDGVHDFSLDGVISYNGVLGATTWTVNVTTGISKPVFPAVPPKLDLNSVNVSTTGAGTLTIMLTDTDFSLPAGWNGQGLVTSDIGGTTDGQITLTQILDPDNSEFAVTTPGNDVSVALGPFFPTAFSGAGNAAFSGISLPFSLTEKVVVVHGAGVSATSFDSESVVVPVPGAILLGLLGLGAAGLKLRRFA